MTDTFKAREASEEARFKMDAEARFKIEARRNKMLAIWASEKLGMISDEKEAFIKEVVASDLEEPGYEDVVRKVSKAFRDGGVKVDDNEIREEIVRLDSIAAKEVAGEYPEPLGDDHGRVGDK